MNVESFSIGGRSYPNEDRLIVQNMGSYGMAAVLADGMGGLCLGGIAADVITKSVIESLMETYRGDDACIYLHRALEYADQKIRQTSIETRSNMGAAVAVTIITGNKLFYTWQGNVRIYIRHEGKTQSLTTDHIAHIGYGKTALTRCLKGTGLREDLQCLCHQLAAGDEIFICTDGMYKFAEDYLGIITTYEIKCILGNPDDDASLVRIAI